MRAILCALCAGAIFWSAAPAGAQNINLMGAPGKLKTQDEVDYEKATTKAYQEQLKKLPDQNAKRDPWGNIRATGPAEPEPKKKAEADPKKKKAGTP